MKRMLMAEQWDQFARSIFTEKTPAVQRSEMRRAFYAGAQSILFRVIESFAPEAEPTDADLQVMQDLNDELQDFAKAVAAGRA